MKAEHNQVNKIKLSFDKSLTIPAVRLFNAEREGRWIVRQEEIVPELKALQQDCEKKVSQVIQEKNDVITSVRKEMMPLVEENVAKLRATGTEIHQSETEWQTKHKTLEDRLQCELAAKERRAFRKHRSCRSRETEEEWLAKEEEWLAKKEEWLAKGQEWLNKASKKEEEMKLLIQQNIELQVRHTTVVVSQ